MTCRRSMQSHSKRELMLQQKENHIFTNRMQWRSKIILENINAQKNYFGQDTEFMWWETSVFSNKWQRSISLWFVPSGKETMVGGYLCHGCMRIRSRRSELNQTLTFRWDMPVVYWNWLCRIPRSLFPRQDQRSWDDRVANMKDALLQ